jgi:hypothetical protein
MKTWGSPRGAQLGPRKKIDYKAESQFGFTVFAGWRGAAADGRRFRIRIPEVPFSDPSHNECVARAEEASIER